MNKEYWREGLLHREDGPAISSKRLNMDYEEYWREGQLHREDGPAVLHRRVREEWFENNQRHRVGGPAISIHGRVRLPLLDPGFNIVPHLRTDLYPWNDFPHVGDQRIPQYLDDIFGGVHPFATYGDFGAMPSVMVEKLGIKDLDLKDVRYRVSYEATLWKSHFWPETNGDNPEMDRNDDGPGILDLLGCYNCTDKTITLFIPSIAECAAELDQIPHSPCGPSAMTLTTLVFLHELGHAIHHARKLEKLERAAEKNSQLNAEIARKVDPIFNKDFLDGLGEPERFHDLGGPKIAETVAQHFMMTCIRAHGVRAEWIEEQLEHGQPWVYSAWRKCGFDTTWDGCRELLEMHS